MPEPTSDRRAELIAAAASESLTDAERAEFDAARGADPRIDAEVAELRSLVQRMSGSLGGWDGSPPSAGLRDRIAAIGDTGDALAGTQPVSSLSEPLPVEPFADDSASAPAATAGGAVADSHADAAPRVISRRSGWLTALAAAACIALGAGVGVAATSAISQDGPPAGAPGTLGALEDVQFTGEPTGVDVDGAVVAHTWGTETLLEIDGLPAGDSYSVVVTTDSGARLTAGSFLGSTVTVDCRMNAAVMRSDAIAIEIEDATGAVVTTAALPSVR